MRTILFLVLLLPALAISAPELTKDEKETLSIGEINDHDYGWGIITGWLVGFGTGHMVQHRWEQDGQLFTWGEVAGTAALLTGAVGCIDDRQGRPCTNTQQDLMIGGFVTVVALRLWEIGDLIVAPPRHNRRLQELKQKTTLVPLIDPELGQGLGLVATF